MAAVRWIGTLLSRGEGAGAFAVAHLALLIIFYWPPLAGTADMYFRDLALYFEPLTSYLGNAVLREGRLPLWNSGLYTGMSQVALGHPNLFYPFTWLMAFLPFSQGLALYLILHQWVLGLGAFNLVRRFRWGAGAAPLAGMAIAWNGYILGLQSNFQLVSAAAWIPVLLAAIGGRRSVARVVLAAISTFLLIGTGAPELIGPGLAIAVAWSFWQTWEERAEHSWYASGSWRLLSIGAGIGLAAPMILPALEWIRVSGRAGGIETVNVLLWSAEWYQWLGLAVSHPFGVLPVQSIPRYLDSPFLGAGLLTLALGGIAAFGRFRGIVFVTLLAFACVLCAGATTPFGVWLAEHLPGFRSIRYPVKLLYFPVLGIVLAAARGLGAVASRGAARRLAWRGGLAGCAVAVAALWQSRQMNRAWEWTTSGQFSVSIHKRFLAEANHALAIHLFGAVLAILLVVLAAWARSRWGVRRGLFARWTVVAIGLPLFASAFQFQRAWAPIGIYRSEPVWDELRKAVQPDSSRRVLPVGFGKRIYAVSPEWLERRLPGGTRGGDAALIWLSNVLSERALLMENTAAGSGFSSSWGYEATPPGLYEKLQRRTLVWASAAPDDYPWVQSRRNDLPLTRFCVVTGSRYLLLKPDPREAFVRYFSEGPGLRPVLDLSPFRTGGSIPRLYEVTGARPRAYVSRSVQDVPDENSLLEILTTPNRTDFDSVPNHSYVLSRDREMVQRFRGERTGEPDSVELLLDQGEIIRHRVQMAGPGLFVLADQYYPGWEATVDGRKVDILRVNLVNRGILVERGTHIVEMRYRPRSLEYGLVVAAFGALLLAGICWRVKTCAQARRST